jgi:hypothetical protein
MSTNPMKKVALFGALVSSPLVLTGAVWLGMDLWKAHESTKFLSSFSTLQNGKGQMSVAQVESLLGAPIRIEHSESTGITADAYHYPTYPLGGDLKVVFVNGVVIGTELPKYQPL